MKNWLLHMWQSFRNFNRQIGVPPVMYEGASQRELPIPPEKDEKDEKQD
jgi:hypothetical protein